MTISEKAEKIGLRKCTCGCGMWCDDEGRLFIDTYVEAKHAVWEISDLIEGLNVLYEGESDTAKAAMYTAWPKIYSAFRTIKDNLRKE